MLPDSTTLGACTAYANTQVWLVSVIGLLLLFMSTSDNADDILME